MTLNWPVKATVINEVLHAALRDNSQVWRLERAGAYRLLRTAGKQKAFLAKYELADSGVLFLELLQTEPRLTIGMCVRRLTACAAYVQFETMHSWRFRADSNDIFKRQQGREEPNYLDIVMSMS